MEIDLSNDSLYLQDKLVLDKPASFIFGRNGTGKSTIVKNINEQFISLNVKVFSGFENLVGEREHFEAVILGEENNDIEQQISNLNSEIEPQKDILRSIEHSLNSEIEGTIAYKYSELCKKLDSEQNQKERFYTAVAREIKNIENPRIAEISYNKQALKAELDCAKPLSDTEINEYKNTVLSDVRIVGEIIIPDISLKKLIENANLLLSRKVEEHIGIKRLDSPEKRQFAQAGMKIHIGGDVCAFCGNIISEESYSELVRYFDIDEIEKLKKELKLMEQEIEAYKNSLTEVLIQTSSFYPEFFSRISPLIDRFNVTRQKYLKHLDAVQHSIQQRISDIFTTVDILHFNSIEEINTILEDINKIIIENNSSDLPNQQNIARNELRLHKIFEAIEADTYKLIIDTENKLTAESKIYKDRIDELRDEAERINLKIKEQNDKISALKRKSQNEEILVQRINEKLLLYASFSLVYLENEMNGYYQIKCARTHAIKSIKELSTGEKNLIAFLYFVEKLKEDSEQDKIVIFDDPMSSNDDVVQYLIISELDKLVKQVRANAGNGPQGFIVDSDLSNLKHVSILTHNLHFYLNIIYGTTVKNVNRVHLVKTGFQTDIKLISNKNEEYKSSYDALWNDLRIVYNHSEFHSSLMLNIIRRIIETYLKFNCIEQNDFYGELLDAKKLFDVNSHSIDVIEAELNGQEKDDIIGLMRDCFVKNNAISHFESFWGDMQTAG